MGGICHALLPQCPDQPTCTKVCGKTFKFVDCSIRHMVKLFDQRDVKRSEIEVKCFGASDMFSRKQGKSSIESVGRQNMRTAEEVILSEGLSILNMDIGGLQGRKILFYTDTGDVLLKRLSKVNESDFRL
jgi:chemotaxis protein CheD